MELHYSTPVTARASVAFNRRIRKKGRHPDRGIVELLVVRVDD